MLKTSLKRDKNITNREIRFFHVEAIPKFFSQLRKKYFFAALKKTFLGFSFSENFSTPKKSPPKIHQNPSKNFDPKNFSPKNLKIQIFKIFEIFIFQEKIWTIKKYFFGVENFWGYSFDVKNLIFPFMMFSVRFEHDKYDFQNDTSATVYVLSGELRVLRLNPLCEKRFTNSGPSRLFDCMA